MMVVSLTHAASTLLSLPLEARVCVPTVKESTSFLLLDPQTKLPACLPNSQVSHQRPCCGREPRHPLGQGKSG